LLDPNVEGVTVAGDVESDVDALRGADAGIDFIL